MLSNVWTIARRDFRSYFTTPIAYIVIGVFLLLMGYFFFGHLSEFAQMNAMSQFGAARKATLTDAIVRPLYGNMNVIFLFLVPFVTMRLLAEEKKQHTIELLLTSPVTTWEIVLGKFLSAFLFLLVTMACTLVYPAVLFATGNPDPGPLFAVILATLLLVSCYLAIGVFFSALTENQIVAGALTFVASLLFWIISWAGRFGSGGSAAGEIFNYLSLIYHWNSLSEGVLNSSDILFFLSFIFVGLFLANRVLDSYRWR